MTAMVLGRAEEILGIKLCILPGDQD
jgi:hypothetical protein